MMILAGAVNGYSMQSMSMGGVVRVGRAAMSKLVAPRMDITVEKAGKFGTTDFTMTFKKVREDLASLTSPTDSEAAPVSHTCLVLARAGRQDHLAVARRPARGG
jgi:hypothetical protein